MTPERIVTLYMQALGDTKLPESVWKKLARANQLVLDDKFMEQKITNNLVDLIEMCSPELREITFHTGGRVIAKTGGKAKFPKRLYTARAKGLHKKSDLVVEALQKLYRENCLTPTN